MAARSFPGLRIGTDALEVVGVIVGVGVGATAEGDVEGGRVEDGEESFDAFLCCSCSIDTDVEA